MDDRKGIKLRLQVVCEVRKEMKAAEECREAYDAKKEKKKHFKLILVQAVFIYVHFTTSSIAIFFCLCSE